MTVASATCDVRATVTLCSVDRAEGVASATFPSCQKFRMQRTCLRGWLATMQLMLWFTPALDASQKPRCP